MPDIGEIRQSADGSKRATWSGSQWMIVPANPNQGVASGRTDTQDMDTFKNIATTVGMTGLPMLAAPETIPMRILMAALGGAAGRGIGHAAVAGAGVPQDASVLGDIGTGAMEGGLGEALTTPVGPIAKYTGKGMQALAKLLGVGESGTSGAVGAGTRAFLAHEMGAGPIGATAAVVAPPALRAAGSALESAGGKLPTRTLSQHMDTVLDALTKDTRTSFPRNPRVSSSSPWNYREPSVPRSPAFEPQPVSMDTGIADANTPNISEYVPNAATGEPASAFPATVEHYAPNVSGHVPGAPTGEPAIAFPPSMESMAPNVSGYVPGTEASQPATAFPPTVEHYAPNTGGQAPSVSPVVRDFTQPANDVNWQSPSVTSPSAPVSPPETPVSLQHLPDRELSDAELHNIERNSPFGEGQIIPGPRPTELSTPSLEGMNTPSEPVTIRPDMNDIRQALGRPSREEELDFQEMLGRQSYNRHTYDIRSPYLSRK